MESSTNEIVLGPDSTYSQMLEAFMLMDSEQLHATSEWLQMMCDAFDQITHDCGYGH